MDIRMSEEIYDAKIVPKLADLAGKCQSAGMSFLAMVEFAPGETGRTEYMTATPGMKMQIALMAARCNGNVDALIMGLMKYAEKHGHGSIFLKQLGVPLVPTEKVEP